VPRFALLRHDGPRGVHWDLLLEVGDVLRTWALSAMPGPGCSLVCESLPDHRRLYLDYEGPVSGGRGTVAREDRGTYEVLAEAEDRLSVDLRGEKLSGRLDLVRLAEPGRWQLRLSQREP
jgi:hypothetical protein